MAEQTIAPVATTPTATASIAAKAPEAAKAEPKAEPPKAEAAGTVGTTTPNIGAGTKVNYYA